MKTEHHISVDMSLTLILSGVAGALLSIGLHLGEVAEALVKIAEALSK